MSSGTAAKDTETQCNECVVLNGQVAFCTNSATVNALDPALTAYYTLLMDHWSEQLRAHLKDCPTK